MRCWSDRRDLGVEVRELPKSERCDKHVEHNQSREQHDRPPGVDPWGENDHHERETNLQEDHPACADQWGHERVEFDGAEISYEDVCGHGVEDIQYEKSESEDNREPAESREFAVVDATARCQLPQTHSGCLPSLPQGAAQRPLRPYPAIVATARVTRRLRALRIRWFLAAVRRVGRLPVARTCPCPQGRLRVARGEYPIPPNGALMHDEYIRHILKGDDQK